MEYVYFIDEIFLPNRELLEALVARPVIFGVQTRIDLWNRDMLDLLGDAGCVSIEAGVESISEEGRNLLDKKCRLTTDEITARLVHARSRVPFVQANLIDARVRRRGGRRGLAAAPASSSGCGRTSRAAVPVPGIARLHAALGRAGRPGLGARARVLPGASRHVQRHPGRAAPAPCRTRAGGRCAVIGGHAES